MSKKEQPKMYNCVCCQQPGTMAMCEPCRKERSSILAEVDTWFREGGMAANRDETQGPCPYSRGSLARAWWDRGYNAQLLMLRLIALEKEKAS